MRELKFRAWDKITKKYYIVSTLEFADNGELCEVWLADILVTDPELNEACKNPKDVILEQYTGLKDKNDKEIYEGDIVQMPLELALRKVGFVAFVNGRFLVKDYEFEDGSYHIVDFYDYNIPNRDFEVFGNIHENGDLLKEEE